MSPLLGAERPVDRALPTAAAPPPAPPAPTAMPAALTVLPLTVVPMPRVARRRAARATVSASAPASASPSSLAPARAPDWDTAPPQRITAGARAADLLLTVAAILGLLVTALTVAAHVSGLRPLVVRSGSMEPTIATGGMVLVRTVPAAEVAVGDVVAVDRPDRVRVTHRVVEVEHRGDTAELVLKGDANEDIDPLPVTVTEAGEVVLSVPSLGRVSAFFASAKGGFVLGCLVTGFGLPAVRRRRG